MDTMAIKGTSEVQTVLESVQKRRAEVQAQTTQQKSAISAKIDQVQISVSASQSQLPTEPEVPSPEPDEPIVETKNPVKEMFMNAEDHQQVDLVQGQLAKNQLETYVENMKNAKSNYSDDSKSSAKIIEITVPSYYEKALNAYNGQG